MPFFVRWECDNVSCYRYVSAGNRRQIKVTSRRTRETSTFKFCCDCYVFADGEFRAVSRNLSRKWRNDSVNVARRRISSSLCVSRYYIFFPPSVVNAVENSATSRVPHSNALPTQLYINYTGRWYFALRAIMHRIHRGGKLFFDIVSETLGSDCYRGGYHRAVEGEGNPVFRFIHKATQLFLIQLERRSRARLFSFDVKSLKKKNAPRARLRASTPPRFIGPILPHAYDETDTRVRKRTSGARACAWDIAFIRIGERRPPPPLVGLPFLNLPSRLYVTRARATSKRDLGDGVVSRLAISG